MIGKKYFSDQVAEQRAGDYLVLEKAIDTAIIRHMDSRDPSRPIRITVTGYSRASIDRALSEYNKTGWFVSHVCDLRDGDYLELV